jgi:hypothetical protein
VAHFGAAGFSWRDANDVLDLELFETIFEDGYTILSEATAGAEVAAIIDIPTDAEVNAWMYLLLGDPELEVWRKPPPPLLLSGHQVEVPPAPGFISVQVHRPSGLRSEPVPFAIVSLYKAGEVFANHYTDADGMAEIPINPSTPGTIYLTAYTDLSAEGIGEATIEVVGGSSVAETGIAPGAARMAITPPPSSAGGPVEVRVELGRAAESLEIRMFNVAGRVVAADAFGSLPAGEHRLRLASSTGTLAGGVYWLEARARLENHRSEVRSRARWLRLR